MDCGRERMFPWGQSSRRAGFVQYLSTCFVAFGCPRTGCRGNSMRCRGNLMPCRGNSMRCHGNSMRCHGNLTRCRGKLMRCHGNLMRCHGNLMRCRAATMRCHRAKVTTPFRSAGRYPGSRGATAQMAQSLLNAWPMKANRSLALCWNDAPLVSCPGLNASPKHKRPPSSGVVSRTDSTIPVPGFCDAPYVTEIVTDAAPPFYGMTIADFDLWGDDSPANVARASRTPSRASSPKPAPVTIPPLPSVQGFAELLADEHAFDSVFAQRSPRAFRP